MSNNIEAAETESNVPEEYSKAPITNNEDNIEVRDFSDPGPDHPLVQYAGQTAKKTDTASQGKLISELIYDEKWAWVREWLQNHETACVRACKLLIRMSGDYPDDWLTHEMWIDEETGETVIEWDDDQTPLVEYDGDAGDLRQLEVPKPIESVVHAARKLGYDPTINWEVYIDERKIVTVDNGIGMTPREFWEAFESPQSSGSDVDGYTGGKFGVGSESVRMVHGEDGGAMCESWSRRPGHEGYTAYTYPGGATAVDGDVDDDFRGTKFEIPVQDNFNLRKLQDKVEYYAQGLRIPLLYQEYDSGQTIADEEYEATSFMQEYEDAPIKIRRPGEFYVAAGPDVVDDSYNSDDPDTFLVSMPIDRNTSARINTFWNVVVQIQDEQGRIVSGPNRGAYRDEIDELDEDDVPMPEPTVDRDRLNKGDVSTTFFKYIEEVIKERELNEVNQVCEAMQNADHASDVVQENPDSWTLFKKMVNYHGSYRVTSSFGNLGTFFNDRDELPELSDQKVREIYNLFKETELCTRGPGNSSKKNGRDERELGWILSDFDAENIYMAASTSGKFSQRFHVLRHTNHDSQVIVVDGTHKYDTYSEYFGFKKLKEVPLTQSDDDDAEHEFDVPDQIHKQNVNKGKTNKPKTVSEQVLKIRNNGDSSSIDVRLKLSEVKERLDKGRGFGRQKLVLFRKGKEKISDHYGVADYAAIASVSQKIYDELAGYDDVLTFSEFKKWSRSTLIPTEDGVMKPQELVDDDRLVVLSYWNNSNDEARELLQDEHEELRRLYCEDVRDQLSWAQKLDGYNGGYGGSDRGEVPDDDKYDVLYAAAHKVQLNRAEWAFDNAGYYSIFSMYGLRLSAGRWQYDNPVEWTGLSANKTKYRIMVQTPNWDNDSVVYDMIPRKRGTAEMMMYLGLHDRGIDPSEYDVPDLRDLIGGDD